MKFKTNISKKKDGVHSIRDIALEELISKHSFVEIIFLLIRGNLPSNKEEQFLNALLVASVENGIEVPSIFVPRISVSTGNPVHVALAAGILSVGERHGGAGEECAELLSSTVRPEEIVNQCEINKKPVAGFGHKIYKNEDPRATAIYNKAKELGIPLEYFERAYEIERVLELKKGKKLPFNIDGAIAAGLLAIGFGAGVGKALFILSRIVGMTAHVIEEKEQGNSYYRLEESDLLTS